MKLEITHKYDDILHLSRPVMPGRASMTMADRAAQFSPFAALTGFDTAIEESGRLTDRRIELTEGRTEELNELLRQLQEKIHQQPLATITYFTYDERKAGGTYRTVTGHVKKIDPNTRFLLLAEGEAIPIPEIFQISLE